MISVVMGPMYSGKTVEGQKRTEEAARSGLVTLIVTSDKDSRYVNTDVPLNVSHNGLGTRCDAKVTQLDASDCDTLVAEFIWVDEGQFMGSGLTEFCLKAQSNGTHVLVTALQSDFKQRPWPNIVELLPHASEVMTKQAYCIICNAKCHYTRKRDMTNVDSVDNVVDPGGADKYAPACHVHFNDPLVIPNEYMDKRALINEKVKRYQVNLANK